MKAVVGLAFMALSAVLIFKFIKAAKAGTLKQHKNWHYRKDGFGFYCILFIYGSFMVIGQIVGPGAWW